MNGEPTDDYRPWATWGLALINIVVFFQMYFADVNPLLASGEDLRAAGGVDAALVWQGEVWRLLTGSFVHGAIWHIGLNMWVLLQVGRILERVVGPARVAVIYLVSGVFGFSISLLTRPGLSVGASGAIFGIVGALVALAVVTRKEEMGRVLMSALAPFVVATFVIGWWLDFVDNGAHFGGLVAGFLLGYGFLADEPNLALALDDDDDDLRVDRAIESGHSRSSIAALVSLAIAFALFVPYSVAQVWNPKWATSRVWTALAHDDVEMAKEAVGRAVKLAPDDAEVLLVRARLSSGERGRDLYDRALTAFDDDARTANGKAWNTALDDVARSGTCVAALARAPSDHELLNNCAWHWLTASNLHERRPARALALAQNARDLYAKPDGTFTVENDIALQYLHTLAIAWTENGDLEEGVAILERVIAQDLGDSFLSDRGAFIKRELARIQAEAKQKKKRRARQAQRVRQLEAEKGKIAHPAPEFEKMDAGPPLDADGGPSDSDAANPRGHVEGN